MADTATTEIEVETPPAEGSPQAEPRDEFVAQLSKIYKRLKFSKKLKSAMKEVEQELLDLLGVRLFTIYIYKKAELDDIRAQALKDGMRTMKQDGIYKIFGGYTDYAQLLRVVAE